MSKVDWLCLSCNKLYQQTYSSKASTGAGCLYCAGKAKKTLEDFQQLAQSLKREYLGPNPPPATKVKVRWRCLICEDVFEQHYNGARNGNGCAKCGNKKRKTLKDYQELAAKTNRIYVGSKDVPRVVEKAKWRCLTCNKNFKQAYISAAGGNGCSNCSHNRKHSIADVKAFGKTRGFALLSNEYTSAHASNLLIRWQGCGHEDVKSWNALSKGHGCWCNVGWTKDAILSVLKSLAPGLPALSPAQRQIVLDKAAQAQGLDKKIAKQFVRGDFFEDDGKGGKKLKSDKDILAELDRLAKGAPAQDDEDEVATGVSVGDLDAAAGDDGNAYDGLPPSQIAKRLADLDDALGAAAITDADAVEELLALEAHKLWNTVLAQPKQATAVRNSKPKGAYGTEVRRRFLAEYDAVRALPLPEGLSTKYAPTLMQRLCAYLVQERRRFGNWSGMGTGKTGSAALASRVVNAGLTVVVAPNGTIETGHWERELKAWFPGIQVATKTWAPVWAGTGPRYLLLNHEMFQQKDTAQQYAEFLKAHRPDFVVIDEVHMVKQRSDEASLRRRNLKTFLGLLPEARVLTMSGTPVINNLREAQSQIELIQGADRDDLPVAATSGNCLRVYRELSKVGFRQRINHKVEVKTREVEVDCAAVVPDLRRLGTAPNPVQREMLLTQVKLPAIMKELKKGRPTLVYTHYVGEGTADIVDTLVRACRKKGLRVGVYTGADKSGFEAFVAGQLDVLVASAAIAVGINGLQHVCSKLVINVLPWTRADYDQLVARLYRTGQEKQVEVVIPVATTTIGGEERSWCRRVMAILAYKKSVADAAVDGVWPDGQLENVQSAYKRWLTDLEAAQREEGSRLETA